MLVFAVAEAFILPPGLFVFALVFAVVALLLGWKRTAAAVASGAAFLMLVLSLEPISDLLIRPLEDRYPPLPVSAIEPPGNAPLGGRADAVVVLGGGQVPVSPELGGRPSPAGDFTKRLLYGALLAREARLPLIISGGTGQRAPGPESEAEAGRQLLDLVGLDPPRILLESRSSDTWENALDVERAYHPKRVYLVTSAFHMERAAYAFARQGVAVIPAPTDYLARRLSYPVAAFLPSADSLRDSTIAIKEYEGILFYRLLGHHHT